jgi:nucleotide-binding universal stress UspA family protein
MMLSPKLILSPIDFSNFSINALETAKDLAELYDSEILLLNVVPVIPDLPNDVSLLGEGTYENELIVRAKQHLEALANKLRQAGARVRCTVGLDNDAAMEIIRTAENEKADLIVIATHGATGWRRVAFGSVSEKVVQTANCPVLVLRIRVAADSPEQKEEPAMAAVSAG